ncbi:MAG: hypothetical protein WC756_13555 [Taibaiella sp.]
MDKMEDKNVPRRSRLANSRSIFQVSIFVAVLTIVAIWLLGLGVHRTLFINSLLSVSILSIAFLLFITIGLYRGVKLRDNVGRVIDKFRFRNFPDLIGSGDVESFDVVSILAWLLAGIILTFLLWLLGNMFIFLILVFIAMLYWIFFRALRLIFKKSSVCTGDFFRSLGYALFYTVLYNFWIYGIIMGAHYFINA